MSDLVDWLKLWRVSGIGPATFEAMVLRFGSPGDALRAAPSELKRLGLADEILCGFVTQTTEAPSAISSGRNNQAVTF
jgi:hypothetical protein